MANYSTLKAAVADVVKTNGTQAITGANLQAVLLSIINSVGGGGYIFKGVATPSTDAGTPDENVFYLGGAGTYANFGTSITVPVGSICVFKYNGSWTKEQVKMFEGIDDVPTLNSDKLVKSNGIWEIGEGIGSDYLTLTKDSSGLVDTYGTGQKIDIYAGNKYAFKVNEGRCTAAQCHDDINSAWVSISDSFPLTAGDKIEFIASINATRFRAQFSTASSVTLSPTKGIYYLTELTKDYPSTKEKVELIGGINKTITATGSGFVDFINVPMIAGQTYRITADTMTFTFVQVYNSSTKAWETLNSARVNLGCSIDVTPTISSDRTRISFDGAGNVTIKLSSYTSLINDKVTDLDLVKNWGNLDTPIESSDFYDKTSFCTKINGLFTNQYTSLCLCAPQSFRNIYAVDNWETIFNDINHNFRDEVCVNGMTFERLADNINRALQTKINRFNDAILNTSTPRHFSLPTGLQGDEPSAIVSEDGEKLYIYAHLKRIETIDGVNWSEPTQLVLTGTGTYPNYIMHCGVNYIDGVYYLIGCNTNAGGDLHLFTSTNGINFTYAGVLFHEGFDFNDGYAVLGWGNPYLIKEYGSEKLYLYIEVQPNITGVGWQICLVTYTNILSPNQDGTIGDHSIDGINNPIIYNQGTTHLANTAGNADFAKIGDNRPLKSNGKYFIYYHGTSPGNISNIFRASSVDLINWTVDGTCYDNRDQPSAGDNTSGNADHCVIEFKGRTYLFYSWNINTTLYQPYIKYTVDDRPFFELLKLRP